MSDDHEDTPPDGRHTSIHEIETSRANGGPPRDDDGPTLTSAQYQRHLVGKIGVLHRAVEKAERASEAHGKKADAATAAARDAKIAAEAIGRTVETHVLEVNGNFVGFARALADDRKHRDDKHAELLAAVAPLVETKTQWSGAKAIAGRVAAFVGASGIGGLIALIAAHYLKGK